MTVEIVAHEVADGTAACDASCIAGGNKAAGSHNKALLLAEPSVAVPLTGAD